MRVIVHGEFDSEERFGWWAESPDHPEYSASADELAELKKLVREAAKMMHWTEPTFEIEPPGAQDDGNEGRVPHAVNFAPV